MLLSRAARRSESSRFGSTARFPMDAIVAALPESVRAVAVLDRTKEPGAPGEPLRLDVLAALADAASRGTRPLPRVVGGRYGLSSKEFTPAMVRAVLDSLQSTEPRDDFTVGIVDDVTHTSLSVDPSFTTDRSALRAVFYGLGSDGTVGANKQTVKIVGEHTDRHAQGYFVYDSKKSGSMTVSHLRFSDAPIHSTYLIRDADFVACHQFGLLDRVDVLGVAAPGATFLLNSPYPADATWDHLPREVQESILEKGLDVHVIDAHRVARDSGLAGQINVVMQVCCFALTSLLPLRRRARRHSCLGPRCVRQARRPGRRRQPRRDRRGAGRAEPTRSAGRGHRDPRSPVPGAAGRVRLRAARHRAHARRRR